MKSFNFKSFSVLIFDAWAVLHSASKAASVQMPRRSKRRGVKQEKNKYNLKMMG